MKGYRPTPLHIIWIVVQMAIIAAIAILFNFFPQYVGYVRSAAEWRTPTPVLTDGIDQHMPWLNLWWGVTFTLLVAELFSPRDAANMLWSRLIVTLYGVAVFLRMATGPAFLQPAWLDGTVRALLGLGTLGMVADLFRIWRQLAPPEGPTKKQLGAHPQ